MPHPNEELARKLYDAFGKGDMETVLGYCDYAIVFHVPGKAPFSGDHTKVDFGDWMGQVMQISAGTFQEDIRDILVSDDRVLVVLDHHFREERPAGAVRHRAPLDGEGRPFRRVARAARRPGRVHGRLVVNS